MKINFKIGIRRIVYSMVGLGALVTLFFFILNGCIFDNYKFTSNINIITDNKQETFSDFYNEFIDPLYLFNFKCYPYQQKCIIEHSNEQLKNNQIYTYINNHSERKQYMIKMPTVLKYFTWQIEDLLKIFFIAGILLGIYFMFEFMMCWIIRGFRE